MRLAAKQNEQEQLNHYTHLRQGYLEFEKERNWVEKNEKIIYNLENICTEKLNKLNEAGKFQRNEVTMSELYDSEEE
jgi:hypothetical protein